MAFGGMCILFAWRQVWLTMIQRRLSQDFVILPTSISMLRSNEARVGRLVWCHVRSLLGTNVLNILAKGIVIDCIPISRGCLSVVRDKGLCRVLKRIIPGLLPQNLIFWHEPSAVVFEVVVYLKPEVPEDPGLDNRCQLLLVLQVCLLLSQHCRCSYLWCWCWCCPAWTGSCLVRRSGSRSHEERRRISPRGIRRWKRHFLMPMTVFGLRCFFLCG